MARKPKRRTAMVVPQEVDIVVEQEVDPHSRAVRESPPPRLRVDMAYPAFLVRRRGR